MKSALIILDMQDAILGNLKNAEVLAENIAYAIKAARQKDLPILQIRAGFRKGAPEISENNKFLFASKPWFVNSDPEQFLKIHAAIAPQENDIVIDRRRISAFAGTDLEIILKANDIRHIVLTGIATSGSVLSTIRSAADMDYKITVLSNGCADTDEEIHSFLMTKIFSGQADVQTIEEWADQLNS